MHNTSLEPTPWDGGAFPDTPRPARLSSALDFLAMNETKFQRSPLLLIAFTTFVLGFFGVLVWSQLREDWSPYPDGSQVTLLVGSLPALVFLVLCLRQISSVSLSGRGITIHRLLWASRFISYSEISEVRISEGVDAITGIPDRMGSYNLGTTLAVVISLREGRSVTLTSLKNGPTGLYQALCKATEQAGAYHRKSEN